MRGPARIHLSDGLMPCRLAPSSRLRQAAGRSCRSPGWLRLKSFPHHRFSRPGGITYPVGISNGTTKSSGCQTSSVVSVPSDPLEVTVICSFSAIRSDGSVQGTRNKTLNKEF